MPAEHSRAFRVIVPVLTARFSNIVISALALLACLSFVLGLSDSRKRIVELPAASPLPEIADEDRDALLAVVVSDDAGAPAVGATVQVFWEQSKLFHLLAAGVSDAAGRSRFEKLPHGRFWILAEAPGFARSSTQLLLESGEREAKLTLTKARQLSVTVTDEEEKPIERATVLVTTGDPLPYGALTAKTGVAVLDRLGRPPWSVKVSAPGYESLSRAGVNQDFAVSLRRLGSIEVRVELPDGAPAVGATVSIAGPTLWPARNAETDKSGVSRIAGLLPGTYDLRAISGPLVSEVLVGFELGRGAHESVTLRLATGRMVSVLVTDGEGESPVVVPNADVVLAEGGVSSFPLQGRTGTDGKVALGPVGSGPATVAARAEGFVASAPVAVPAELSGPVRVALLRGGRLKGLVVDARDYPVDGASIEVVGTDAAGLPIAETPELVNFRRTHFAWALPGPPALIPAGELGVMPGPVPPIPKPGESVEALLGGTVVSAMAPELELAPWVTRFDGRFEAHPVTPGRVRAIVRHPDYVEGVSDVVTLTPGGEAEVKVVLMRGGSLEGRVLDDRGYPVEGAEVEIIAQRGTFQRSVITAGDGSYAFAALPLDITISVTRAENPARVALRKQMQVAEGARERMDLTLPPPRDALRVVVNDDEDQPIELAEVSVLSLDPDAPLRVTQFTDELGEITVEEARGLELRVLVEAPGFARTARVVKEAPENLTIKLQRGLIVEGRITAIRGRQSVANALVTLVSDGARKVTNSDGDGMYRFRDVPPGSVRVQVSHPDYAEDEFRATVVATGRSDRPFELPVFDLEEPAEIEGEVLDSRGDPVQGARVAVGSAPAYLPAGVMPRGVAVTDANGQFVLHGVKPGVLTLEAFSASHGRGVARGVEARASRSTRDVEIRLTPAGSSDESFATGGVAVTLGERGSGDALDVVVVAVAEASEAERGGLTAGDVLVSIDGAAPTSMGDARARLNGPNGSDVVVEIDRGGTEVGLRIRREAVRR